MSTIAAQLQALKKLIKIPYKIVFVDHVVKEKDYKEKVIYVHIWI